MKIPNFSTRLVLAALSVAGTGVLLFPQSTIAQTPSAQPLQDFQTQDNPDPFSDRGNGTGVFDLIHRSQLGTLRNMDEFNAQQRKNLNDAAAEFREKQRALLQQQQQAKPVEEILPPQDGTPSLPQ